MCSHVSKSRNSRKPGFERPAALALCAVLFFAHGAANAQDKGTLDPEPLPPLAKPDGPKTLAKELFARKTTPSPLPARSIGFYAHGCLAGARRIAGQRRDLAGDARSRATATGAIRA